MAIDVNVPVATNQVSADLTAMANNMKLIVCGDGTAGRVLRLSKLTIEDGTGAGTIKCTMTSVWNDTGINTDAQDNINSIGAVAGYYIHRYTGYTTELLIIDSTAFAGNIVSVLDTTIYSNSSDSTLDILGYASSNDLYFVFRDTGTGLMPDLATILTAGESIVIYFTYLTSA